MIGSETWYWKILKPYWIRDEEGCVIGVKDDAPAEAKKAYEDDVAKTKQMIAEAEGYLIG